MMRELLILCTPIGIGRKSVDLAGQPHQWRQDPLFENPQRALPARQCLAHGRDHFVSQPLCAWGTIFAVFALDSVPRRPSPPPLTNLLASSLPCSVTAVLSTLKPSEPSTINICAAVKTPCANTPLLSAYQFSFLEAIQAAFRRGKRHIAFVYPIIGGANGSRDVRSQASTSRRPPGNPESRW